MQAPQWTGLAADVRARVRQLSRSVWISSSRGSTDDVDRLAVELERHRLLLRPCSSPLGRFSGWRARRRRAMRAASSRRPSRSCIPRRRAGPRPARRCFIARPAASAIDASVNVLPRSASSAARALSGVGPTLVSAMQTSLTVSPFMRNSHRRGGGGEIADLALELGVAVARARRGDGDADLGHDLVGLHLRVVGADEEPVGGNDALARRGPRSTNDAPRASISAGWSLPGSPCEMSPPSVPL